MSLSSEDLEIKIWDVQHGNAIYIKTPNETNIIIDLGTGNYGDNNTLFSPLLHLKNKQDLFYIDLLIITHPDLDHIQDILNLRYFSVRCLIRPYGISIEDIKEKIQNTTDSEQKKIFNNYIDLIKKFTAPVPDNANPLYPQNNGGVNIKIYRPEPNTNASKANNYSIVTIISYASSKIIIPGDNEEASWKWLLEKEEFKNDIIGTNIFFAPHHGRKSGYYNELFNYITPNLVIISDGHVCDTSATSRYSTISKGWLVHDQNGNSIDRKCLTTRNDGMIIIKMGYNSDGKPYLDIRI